MTKDSYLQHVADLNDSVHTAATFFAHLDPDLYDGHGYAHDVLAQLVFWHREYINILRCLVAGLQPHLRQGAFGEVNEHAAQAFANLSMREMATHWLKLQGELDLLLRMMPDPSIHFPIKHGCRNARLPTRLRHIRAHIDRHVARMTSAVRHGDAWVQAYYGRSPAARIRYSPVVTAPAQDRQTA
jgi:hypothetical protein